MNHVAWLLFVLSAAAAGHPGHDALEPHFHALWEVAWSFVIIVGALIYYVARGKRRRLRNDHAQVIK
jgi:cytosine/uracil/thiamine/allantoin permease